MLKATALVSAIALCLALPAQAASSAQRNDQVAAPVTTTLHADVVEVQTERPNPAGTIIGDAVGGAVLGAAIGGGVSLYNRYGKTNGTWDNWERNVLVGAGIGLGVGLIVGGISAASQAADRTWATPATEHRDIGFSPAMGSYGVNF